MTKNTFCITGATGFVGKFLLKEIQKSGLGDVHALSRSGHPGRANSDEKWFQGDLTADDSLDHWMAEGGILIHLAYAGKLEPKVVEKLFRVAHYKKAKRVIFCTTAMVVGRAQDSVVTETSAAFPMTDYELEKAATEKTILSLGWSMPVTILRPTVVFGPEGKNLLFAMPGFYAGGTRDLLRRMIFGQRKMHLVSVHNVVAAILHLAQLDPNRLERVYQVTDDESPISRFDEVYRIFLKFKKSTSPLTVVLPPIFMSAVLRATGRSLTNPSVIFSQARLRKSGFVPVVGLEPALNEFFAWYEERHRPSS